ncbi:MAG: zinc-dependent metalloprotease [Arachidicoccus sp.]|nr:zinc-dependent metalloprotease [Arachidicoccus sp.]
MKVNSVRLMFLIIGTTFLIGQSNGQRKKNKQKQDFTASIGKTKDTATKPLQPKLFNEVIKGNVKASKGLLNVYKIDNKYYYEIPRALFTREVLIINRIAQAPVNMYLGVKSDGFSGDGIGGNVIRFEEGPNHKLFIRKIFYTDISTDSTKDMYKSIRRNSVQPIIATFPIAAYGKDSSVVVDMTSFIESDNDLFYFSSPVFKQIMHLGSQQNEMSYVDYIKSFPQNVELKAVKTYSVSGTISAGNTTLELNSSLVLLPINPMKKRMYDERVGYFTENYFDFDANPDGVKPIEIVARWRLEPKKEDEQKYLSGELVEPKKQIVFYIDPTTPSKWVPYLIQGVNDWNSAFEQAGFKNAITARLAPTKEEDSTFSMEDAMHSAIVYKPSIVANASGPHISDPRTGEIIESHVNWYHNVMNLIHNWYMVQCGAVDTAARHMIFSDSLMGQLIRFVSSHEIGHTLGLRHNFGASSTVPVDSLRSRSWLEKHGHCPSIMDYARFDYVAQPEDNIPQKDLFPRIGEYDKWAIEWGYRWFPQSSSVDDETSRLVALTTQRINSNKRLWFGSEISSSDPRCQNEDLGNNDMLSNTYGIKNLKRILPKLVEWTNTPNEGYDNLEEMYNAVNNQFDRYLLHVIKYIGGTYVTPNVSQENKNVYDIVPEPMQKEALQFLDDQLFHTPKWLLDPAILGKLKIDPLYLIGQRQDAVLGILINNYTLNKILTNETIYGKRSLSVAQVFNILDKCIWIELYNNTSTIDIYKRNLQKMYVDKLLKVAYPSLLAKTENNNAQPGLKVRENVLPAQYSDAASFAKVEVDQLLKFLKHKQAFYKDAIVAGHIQDLIDRIIYYKNNFPI